MYYRIEGATTAALQAGLEQIGRPTTGGGGYGYTQTEHRWHYRFAPSGNGCRATAVAVESDIRITLPQWEPPAGAPAQLIVEWRRFHRALAQHEEGHAAIGVSAAQVIAARLWAVSIPSCTHFPRAADQVAQDDIQAEHQAHQAYDSQTRHGATQGAVFPPRPD